MRIVWRKSVYSKSEIADKLHLRESVYTTGRMGGNPFTTYMTSYSRTPCVPLKTDNDTGDQGDRTSARAAHRSCVWSTRIHSTYIYGIHAHMYCTHTHRKRTRDIVSGREAFFFVYLSIW